MADPWSGDEPRLPDLATFLQVVRLQSISGAARSLAITPSQVSKAVARLERQFGVKLVLRGARGIEVSDAGRQLALHFSEVLSRLASLRAPGGPAPELTVVATSFLSTLFVPAMARRLPALRVRSLELPPGVGSALASQSFFQIALTTGDERWPSAWVQTPVGHIRRALFASPAVAARITARGVSVERIRKETFIAPIYSYNGHVLPGNDGCPLPYAERRIGHETQTLLLALSLAAMSEQVVFAPALAARDCLRRGELVEIPVPGWNSQEPLQLVCHGEHVRASVQKELTAAIRAELVEPARPAAPAVTPYRAARAAPSRRPGRR